VNFGNKVQMPKMPGMAKAPLSMKNQPRMRTLKRMLTKPAGSVGKAPMGMFGAG
jgi:hypothetical protein